MEGRIDKSENAEYIVACVVCEQQKPVMMYAHRQGALLVGWVFVCADDQHIIQDADVRIEPGFDPATGERP